MSAVRFALCMLGALAALKASRYPVGSDRAVTWQSVATAVVVVWGVLLIAADPPLWLSFLVPVLAACYGSTLGLHLCTRLDRLSQPDPDATVWSLNLTAEGAFRLNEEIARLRAEGHAR